MASGLVNIACRTLGGNTSGARRLVDAQGSECLFHPGHRLLDHRLLFIVPFNRLARHKGEMLLSTYDLSVYQLKVEGPALVDDFVGSREKLPAGLCIQKDEPGAGKVSGEERRRKEHEKEKFRR
jgi:hypothetical protein